MSLADCEVAGRVERCDRPACRWYIPPVAGELLRRNPLCALVAFDVAAQSGGVTLRDAEWLLSMPRDTAKWFEKTGMRKVRLAMAEDVE